MTTATQLYVNNARTSLSGSILSTDTTINVTDGSAFPTPSSGQYFLVTLEASGILEVVKVQGRTGNSFTSCVRGYEASGGVGVATGFPGGTRIENRPTAGTFTGLATGVELPTNIVSIDLLTSPITSDTNVYICSTVDESGNPIVAFRKEDYVWRFSTHPTVFISGVVDSVTTTVLTSSSLVGLTVPPAAGQYILQFTTGDAAGTVRIITLTAIGSVTWSTVLGTLPTAGDSYEIYKSLSSSITSLENFDSDDGMIYSIILSD